MVPTYWTYGYANLFMFNKWGSGFLYYSYFLNLNYMSNQFFGSFWIIGISSPERQIRKNIGYRIQNFKLSDHWILEYRKTLSIAWSGIDTDGGSGRVNGKTNFM